MLTLPAPMLWLLTPLAPRCQRRTWAKVPLLVIGAVLAPRKRTITAILRVLGLADEQHFARYHHVLSRARWSGLAASRILLRLLLHHLGAREQPLIFAIDETLERRWGPKIAARGIYRDAARSSHSHLVKASALRWISRLWLGPIPWAQRVWALPFLTALAPSARACQQQGQRHQPLSQWARHLIAHLRHWLPDQSLVIVADGTYAVLDLLAWCGQLRHPVTMIVRLRLDAALDTPAPPRRPGQLGRPRLKGPRLPSLQQRLLDPATTWTRLTVHWYGQGQRLVALASDTAVWYHAGNRPVPLRWVLIRDPLGRSAPQALLCPDLRITPVQILVWFQRRWQVEVTFQEVRAHLGVETQRQWSDLVIARTTPVLLGLFSWITLAAQALVRQGSLPVRTAAWYPKPRPTFADAIALVRPELWPCVALSTSPVAPQIAKIPRHLLHHLAEIFCYAA